MLSDWIMVPCLLGSIKVLYVYSRCYLDIQLFIVWFLTKWNVYEN